MKVLDVFSLGKFSSLFSPGEIYFELSADKICRATAQMLLQNAVKFNLAEFQEVWQQSVPEGMITRLEQLKVSSDGDGYHDNRSSLVTKWNKIYVGTESGANLFP